VIICGKTGTIQNPHGEAHSAFVAFAPKINPKIAIAVYIENGVWGARYAAPIASLIIEKYLKGKIAPSRQHFEDAMFNSDLISTMKNETGD
jgi:penicillin-binding protein 2